MCSNYTSQVPNLHDVYGVWTRICVSGADRKSGERERSGAWKYTVKLERSGKRAKSDAGYRLETGTAAQKRPQN